MDANLLSWLRCQFCGGHLRRLLDHPDGSIENEILTCQCGRYPVVAGIPILKKDQINKAGLTADEIIGFIESGQHREALLNILAPATPTLAPGWLRRLPPVTGMRSLKHVAHLRGLREWRERATNGMIDPGDAVKACDVIGFQCRYQTSGIDNFHYFAYRFGQPRYLVALSFVSIIEIPQNGLLDLGCGYGQVTWSLVQRAKGRPVFGVDIRFPLLYVAKKWIAPLAEFVCCAADASLPFPDAAFSVIFSSDAFHYFVNKAICARETKRVMTSDGFTAWVWVRSALARSKNVGYPLAPQGYEALVDDLPHRLVADRDVLSRYLQKQGPPLARSTDMGRLVKEPVLSIIASRCPELFQDYDGFTSWPHAEGSLALNPLFVREPTESGGVLLHRSFPSPWYEEDHAECHQYLPETLVINRDILADLLQGKRTAGLEDLIARQVVVGMPERFR
jgi:SAM-dependent methyltransferase